MKKKFKVSYNWLPYGESFVKKETKRFSSLIVAKKFLNYINSIPKDEKNERIFKGSAKIEQLSVKDINTLSNKKTYKWYKVR